MQNSHEKIKFADFPTERHELAFNKITTQLIEQEVLGILLIGSLAAGDAKEDSDIDIFVIRENIPADGEHKIIDGVEVQILWRTPEYLGKALDMREVCVTMLRYNKIVYDPEGILKKAQEKLERKFAGSYPINQDEITALRIFLTTLPGELASIRQDYYFFNYIFYNRIQRLISYFYELKRLWKPRPKYIIKELKKIDEEFYELILKAYEESDIEEKIELIEKISQKCLDLTDGPLYEGLYKIF